MQCACSFVPAMISSSLLIITLGNHHLHYKQDFIWLKVFTIEAEDPGNGAFCLDDAPYITQWLQQGD